MKQEGKWRTRFIIIRNQRKQLTAKSLLREMEADSV
jgi:hypothetical protein